MNEGTPVPPPLDPVFFAGTGPEVLAEAARATGLDAAQVLRHVVGGLLVHKGVDWTSPILSEYLGLYDQSLASFVLVWDRVTSAFVAHGAHFQSAQHPEIGLVAHIRTDDRCRGRGLGSQVVARVVQAGFDRGARLIVLATDDKLHRLQAGERAANRLYARLGFAVLAEKRLADTVDWLMVIDAAQFAAAGGRGSAPPSSPGEGGAALVAQLRSRFAAPRGPLRCEAVGTGDLAALFLLLNLCPPGDFRLKLAAWNVHLGPEFEREFVVGIRPAISDRDRVEDASRLLRDADGSIVAVCAARLEAPFTRGTYRIDFYCLPAFLESERAAVRDLVEQTLRALPRPTRVAFWGVDPGKLMLFGALGFNATGGRLGFTSPATGDFEAREYACPLPPL